MAAPSPSPADLAKSLAMAQQELDYRVDLFNRYKDGELNVGEHSCVDRCCAKYWQVTGIVGQMLGAQGQM